MRDLRRRLTDNRLLRKRKLSLFVLPVYLISPGEVLSIDVCGITVPLELSVRDIGVVLNKGVDMSAQVSNACRGACYNRFHIAKIHAGLTTALARDIASRLRQRDPVLPH